MTESMRKELHVGEIYRVEIEKVAHGGHFIARHEGAVIFVRHAIPGEIVEVEITGLEKSLARADVVAVIEAAPSRVISACKYSGKCGGCDFQHIEVAHQRELKSDVISEQFARIAKMEIDIDVEEASSPLHWRTRYAASTSPRGEIGYKGARSNQVITISNCPVLVPEIDFPTLPHEKIGANKRVEVSMGTTGERSISTETQRESRTSQRSQSQLIEGKKELLYDVAGNTYTVSQSSFWQSNINAPEVLVDAVLEYAQLQEGDHLLDLYGGVGLFALAAIDSVGAAGRIDIVEGSASATSDARRNCQGHKNIFIHTGDVAREMDKFSSADVVVLDPPRTGAGKDVVASLAGLEPRRIVYVACDPAALARDTSYLRDGGYHLEDIRAFDLFPMTHHIECIAVFTLSKVS
ncbi:MAG: class I SAM-dependent RNA methyltransferase [Candidatus Planktophila sp.]